MSQAAENTSSSPTTFGQSLSSWGGGFAPSSVNGPPKSFSFGSGTFTGSSFSFGSGSSTGSTVFSCPPTSFSFGSGSPTGSSFSFGSGSTGFGVKPYPDPERDSTIMRQWCIDHDFEMVQWAKLKPSRRGSAGEPKQIVCAYLAAHKQLGLLEIAKKVGYSYDSKTTLQVAKKGDFTTLEWLLANGCAWNPTGICNWAAKVGDLKLIKYTVAKAGDDCARNVANNAARYDHLAIVQWVVVNKLPHIPGEVRKAACGEDNEHIADWLDMMSKA